MKNIIKILLVILVLIVTIFSIKNIVYAIDNNNFFYANNTNVAPGDTVELIIDLNKIEYETFESVLSTDLSEDNIDKIYTDNSNVDINIKDNKLTVSLSKQEIEKLTLYYKVPDNLEVGTEIKLTATITNSNDEEKTENTSNNKEGNIENTVSNVEAVEEENLPNNKTDENNTQEYKTAEVILKVTNQNITDKENNNDDKNNGEKNQGKENEDINISNESKDIENTNNSNNIPNRNTENAETELVTNNNLSKSSNMQYSSNGNTTNLTAGTYLSSNVEETVQYNGSNNNYLKDLSIEGYELSSAFSKENNTYFLTVESSVDSITVNTEAEDENSIVYIYGNNTLAEGTNKILISVTAENGNVRNYRIYVTK